MKTEYDKERNFIRLQADKGMVVTDYVEGSDIINYHSSKSFICSIKSNIKRYYEITEEKDAEYKKQREEAVTEMLKEKGLN